METEIEAGMGSIVFSQMEGEGTVTVPMRAAGHLSHTPFILTTLGSSMGHVFIGDKFEPQRG